MASLASTPIPKPDVSAIVTCGRSDVICAMRVLLWTPPPEAMRSHGPTDYDARSLLHRQSDWRVARADLPRSGHHYRDGWRRNFASHPGFDLVQVRISRSQVAEGYRRIQAVD